MVWPQIRPQVQRLQHSASIDTGPCRVQGAGCRVHWPPVDAATSSTRGCRGKVVTRPGRAICSSGGRCILVWVKVVKLD